MCTGGEVIAGLGMLGGMLWGEQHSQNMLKRQEKAYAEQLKKEEEAMRRAEAVAREQMAMQERLAAQNMALYEQALYRADQSSNPRQSASASGSRSRESQAARSGPASTLLTGPGGIDVEELQLGRTSLLGA